MPDRPPIPAKVVNSVLVASGHRCSVCGVPCPLERAHIVPWHKTKDHSAENLICLCANCHERADKEHWGEEVLQEYKANPWVLKQNGNDSQEVKAGRRRRVRIVIAKDFEEFGEYEESVLQHALAHFLHVPATAVRIVAKQRGSVIVVVSMPEYAAYRLAEAYQLRREELLSSLTSFPILSLELEEVQPSRSLEKVNRNSPAPLDSDIIAGLRLMAAVSIATLGGPVAMVGAAIAFGVREIKRKAEQPDHKQQEQIKKAIEWIEEIEDDKPA